MSTAVALLAVALCVAAGAHAQSYAPTTVTTQYGNITGYAVTAAGASAPNHNIFWGIPFAESTAGANRWQPPVPKAAWAPDTLNATAFGPACPQGGSTFLDLPYSEDCLYLNVWTPANAQAGPYAVLVWIHGGGYFFGTGADPVFYGDYFANATASPNIVVTINYRLGALGFLNTAQLSGNYGTMDQQLALKWVKENIASFGGDPNRITIWGQSAGGMSIATHLYIPSSWSYYSAAILDSNPAGLLYRRPADNVEYANALARDLLCAVDNLECLRSRTWKEVVDVQLLDYLHSYKSGLNTSEILIWGPVVDGTFFPDTPWNLLQSGAFNKVPVLMGSMRNDSFGFVDALQPIFGDKTYEFMLNALFHNYSAQVLERYPAPTNGDAFTAFAVMATDYLFQCPIRRIAELMYAAGNERVWQWLFVHVPSFFPESNDKKCVTEAVCHSAELAFAFNSATQFAGHSFTPAEEELSVWMNTQWTSFANALGMDHNPEWSAWTPANDVYQIIGGSSTPQQARAYHAANCDFFDEIGYIF